MGGVEPNGGSGAEREGEGTSLPLLLSESSSVEPDSREGGMGRVLYLESPLRFSAALGDGGDRFSLSLPLVVSLELAP